MLPMRLNIWDSDQVLAEVDVLRRSCHCNTLSISLWKDLSPYESSSRTSSNLASDSPLTTAKIWLNTQPRENMSAARPRGRFRVTSGARYLNAPISIPLDVVTDSSETSLDNPKSVITTRSFFKRMFEGLISVELSQQHSTPNPVNTQGPYPYV
jgi:hypothetical protein